MFYMTMQGKKRFVLYVVLALIISGINIGVYWLVYNLLIKSIIIANICAYTASITISFIINRKIVFGSKKEKILKKFVLYILMKLLALGIDSCVLYILKDCLGVNNLISKIIANTSTTFSNYFISKKILKDKES